MNEPIDFFALLNQTKETKKAEEPKKQEVKEASSKKKEIKKESFDEQYKKSKGTPAQVVVDYLLGLGIKELMQHPDVSINGMWSYIKSEARKKSTGGCAAVEDAEVYGWGRHYYDEHGKVTG